MHSAILHLLRHPRSALAIIAVLAIGIGANAAVFSAVRSVILAPLPFPDSGRLIRIVGTTESDGELRQSGVFPRHFDELQRRNRTLEAVTAHRFRNLTLTGDSDAQRVTGIGVTGQWERTIGIAPILGRTFDPGEYAAGSESGVVIISHGLWQRHFGGSRDILGRMLQLNERAYSVIGVMPQQFNFPYDTDLWLPLVIDPVVGAPGDLNVSARVRPGVSIEQAVAELESLGVRISAEAVGDERRSLTARTFDEEFPRDPDNAIGALSAAVGFVLLLVCVNVANLQLAQAASRTRETAVRAALGATRTRQIRDLLRESLLLAMVAVVIGIGFAVLVQDWLAMLVPPRLGEVVQSVRVDGGVLAFTAVVGALTAILFGLMPAWQLTRTTPAEALKSGGRTGPIGGRWMRPLVVAQVGLAFVLLVGAGLMAQNFMRLMHADVGYDPDRLYRVGIGLPEPRYDDPELRATVVGRIVEEVNALPGVVTSGTTSLHPVPHTNANVGARLVLPGMAPENDLPVVNSRMVSPKYFSAVGIPILRGETFDMRSSAASAPVAVVSSDMARRFWPDDDPIGKRFRPVGDDPRWYTVIGIVGEIAEPNFAPTGTLYRLYSQATREQAPGLWSTTSVALMVRARRGSGDLMTSIRDAVWAIDRSLTIFDAAPMTAVLAEPLDGQKFGAAMFIGFGSFALLLAALGTYAVVRLSVAQREREFGIRVALGIRPLDLGWLVVRDGLVMIGGGLAFGMAIAIACAPLAPRFLDAATAHDPRVAVSVLAVQLAAGLLAIWLPARRAARGDPMQALRQE